MIGRVASSSDFGKSLRYVFAEQKKAKVVFGNFAEATEEKADVSSIIKRFKQHAELNTRVKKPCYHLKFSPDISDDLDDGDWAELSISVLKKLKLEANQAIGVLHKDTYYPDSSKVRIHLHLIVNKTDYLHRSSSSKNLYFDHFKISEVLSEFEVEKNLKQIHKQPYSEKTQNESIRLEKSNEGREKALKDSEFLLDDAFENTANSLKTNDPQLNGLDVISYGLTSVGAIAKIAAALAKETEDLQEKKQLEEIRESAESISLSAELMPEDSPELVSEAIAQIAPAQIPEFIEQGHRFLIEAEVKQSDPIFDCVKNYLDSIDFLTDQESKNRHDINHNENPQYKLIDEGDSKSISISVKDSEVYRSQMGSDGRWVVKVNNLDRKTSEVLRRLPQTREEAFRDYAGSKIAQYLLNHITAQRVKEFPWCPEIVDGENVEHQVKSESTKEGMRIGVHDRNNTKILDARVSNSLAVEVLDNSMPLTQLNTFIKWYESEYKQTQKRNARRNEEATRIKRKR